MIYTLDIETKPNEAYTEIMLANAAWKPKDAHKKMATSPTYNEIYCVGVKELYKKAELLSLVEFAQLLENDREAQFITFNGKLFDIPTLILKGVSRDIKMPYDVLMRMCRKYHNDRHIDLMEILTPYEKLKKDALVEVYLDKKPRQIDFKTCTNEELNAHCLEDLRDTEALYLLFEPICQFGG